jgi:hypothetical protein
VEAIEFNISVLNNVVTVCCQTLSAKFAIKRLDDTGNENGDHNIVLQNSVGSCLICDYFFCFRLVCLELMLNNSKLDMVIFFS